MPSQSPAVTAIPRLARPPQVQPSTSGRPLPASMPQPQQHTAQLSQQQLPQWHAQQLKAYQQRMLEQQLAAQQNICNQQAAFSAAPHYDREEVPALSSSAAVPFCVPSLDAHHSQNAQESFMQQVLYQQMYEAALAQQMQQQHMKATVSAGAINLIQQQASDGTVQPASCGSRQGGTPEADQMTAARRASEGQVYTSSATCQMSIADDVDSVTSAQSQSTDVVPASAPTFTGAASPSQCRDETFKVPFPPDHVRY